MVSHENKVILFAILVALPVTLGALRLINDYWFNVPSGSAVPPWFSWPSSSRSCIIGYTEG